MVALETLKDEETIGEPTSRLGVHPMMIQQWQRALLGCATGAFERASQKTRKVNEKQVKDLHAKIGESAVANFVLARKLKAWTGKYDAR